VRTGISAAWATPSPQHVLEERRRSGLAKEGFGRGTPGSWAPVPGMCPSAESAPEMGGGGFGRWFSRRYGLAQQIGKAAPVWDGRESWCLGNLLPTDGARGWERGDGRAAPRGSLLTRAALGLFLATFSLSSFERSQHPSAPTACHLSKERCGWLPTTTGAPNYMKSRVRFLFQRETLKFAPPRISFQIRVVSLQPSEAGGRISERAEDFLWAFSKKCSLVLGKYPSACSAAKLSLAVFKSAFFSKITSLRTGEVLQTS